MELKVVKLNKDAKIPLRAYPADAGLDLFSSEKISIAPGQILGIKTGIAIELPPGTAGLIWDKSGLAKNFGIKTLGGVIDQNYRGEIIVLLTNLSTIPHHLEIGDKIAQLLIQKIETPKIIESKNITKTDRGSGGFGTTGRR